MPSHTENFGIVAAEALFHNTPVIASKNTPWQVLNVKNAGFHINNTPESIADSVIKLLKDIDLYKKYCHGSRGIFV